MNVDEILAALNAERVDYLLIGGMNFLLRHIPELTFDVDIWECRARALPGKTATGIPFRGVSDQDMLTCQEALPPSERKLRRIEVLRNAIEKAKSNG